MKVWEKIMLYPIGLCYWIADSAKKTGNFIGRKAKPAIAMLVAVTMMLSLMPITAFAVSSDIIVGGANLGDGSTTVYYKNGDTSGNLTGTAEDYNAKLETVGGVTTLTIKNLSVAKTADAGIKSYVSLNLVLEGASSIAEKDDDSYDCRGIFVNGDLTISGDGVLSVTAGDAADDDSYGIYVNGTLTIKSGTINATGGTASGSSYGIYATTVMIHDGTVNATGGSAGVTCGIYSDDVRVAGGVTVATGGTASGGALTSYGISISSFGDATVTTIGGVLVARSGSGETTKAINGTLTTNGTQIAGQVVGGTFAGSPASYDTNATAVAIVPNSYTVKNTKLTEDGVTEYTINTDTAVVVSGAGSDIPLTISGGSTVTLTEDLVLINLQGVFTVPALQLSGSTTKSVRGPGTLTAIGAANNTYSYGITSVNSTDLSVDGAKVIAIGGTASEKSNGIKNVNVTVGSSGSITAIGGAAATSYGIESKTTVNSGTLNAIGGAASGGSYGISGTTTVNGGTLNAIGGTASTNSYGINGQTTANGGTLNAIGGAASGMSCGIYYEGSIGLSVANGAAVTAIGGTYGLAAKYAFLSGGSFTGGTGAVHSLQDGGTVAALLATGYGYFAGETQLIPADSDATVGEANQTVTVKEAPIPHKHCVCGGTGAAGDHTSCEDITWTEWDGTVTFPGGNVYLTDDITLTEALTISGTVNLCLNGHKVSAEGGYFDVSGTLNLCSCVAGGSIIRTSTTEALISADAGATANLYNVTLDGGAVWEGTTDTVLKRGTTNSNSDITSSAPLIYAGGQRTAGGHITLNSGVILQNNECSDAGDGGAVTIGEDGTLVINGATICNNAKTDGNAGAIKAYAGAQITLNSGEIYGNEAYKHGGAVQIFGGDSTDYATAVFTMNGGTIRNNKADGVGGGVAVSNYSSFTMNGGTIKDNATTDYSKRGGGVGFGDKNTAMSISGNAVISGNVAGINANNLYIGNNDCNKLSVETMGSNANVGVTMSSPGVFSSGGASYAAQFNSDNAAYKVATDGSNLKLVALHTHNYTYSATGNIITESCTCGHEETATVSGPTGTIVYDGTEKKGATVSYSTGWLGGTLTVTYQNNINAGQATASITKAGATASVKFTINKAEPDYTLPMGVTATYGDTLEDIKISDWGSGWSWKEPTTSVGDVGTKTFVAVFTPTDTNNYKSIEVDITVTVNHAEPGYNPPTAKQDLVYSGIEKELVNKGTATGGSMQYALGADGTTAPASGWSTYVPVGRDAGTYYVWYKVVGDENHNDVAPACIAVTIAKKQIAKPVADSTTFTYNGSYQTYALNGDPAFIIDNNVQKNAGSYTVTVTLQDTANYEWTDGTTAVLEYTFKIEQKEIGISWSNTALTYNGAAQRPTATATGVVTGEQIALLLSAPETNAGSYTAMVRGIDGETAQNYKLPAGRSTTFTIEQQALTIVWGNSNFTYDGAEKFPAFNVEGIWNADDVQVTKEGAQTNAGEYTAQIIGLTGSDAGNYKLTGTLTKDYVINKADQAAPAVNKADETISGKNDGKITDVTANMEYRAEGEDRYTAITGETVENLADGKYYVRVKGDSNHNPSADTAVVIGAGRMLTVTVPQNQVGYTMITTTPEVEYFGSIRVEFKLHDGYSMTDSFQICNGTDPVGFSLMGDTYVYGLNFVNSDFNFTVSGVADITAPLAQIDIKNNKWTSFWNGVTFGLFFNETQDVTVTAADTGSGMNSIQYYLAGGELELDEVKQITDWQDYNGTFKIDPNNRYVVYAKVTDNAGNVSYLNSDGVVLDQTVPVLVGIENNGSYYGDQCFKALDDYLDALKVDGVDVTDEMNADNEYTIVADNAEHIVIATDKAGNATEYKITVFKNYTVTYKVDGNTVSTQTVGHGMDATAPTIPEKEGYTQTAPVWDKDGTNITADTEINAVYTINKYTVTYKADGNVVGTVEVEHGKDAAAPAIPEKEGYTKTAPVWDKDGKNITADTEINAVYTINEYTITFKDENGVYKTLTVKHGEAVTMPEVPAKDGYTVTWDTTIEKVTDNATVNAVYTKNAVSDNPQTGDNSNLWLWWILLIVSAFGITVICIEQKKRKTMR